MIFWHLQPLTCNKMFVQGKGKERKEKTRSLSLEIPGMESRVWVLKAVHAHLICYLVLIPRPLGFQGEHRIPDGQGRYRSREACGQHVSGPPPGLCRPAPAGSAPWGCSHAPKGRSSSLLQEPLHREHRPSLPISNKCNRTVNFISCHCC